MASLFQRVFGSGRNRSGGSQRRGTASGGASSNSRSSSSTSSTSASASASTSSSSGWNRQSSNQRSRSGSGVGNGGTQSNEDPIFGSNGLLSSMFGRNQASAGVFGGLFSDAARMRMAMEASQQEANRGPPPTKQSVLKSLRQSCLDLEDIRNGNDVCTICLDEQHVGDLAIKLSCGHCFHKKCVWPWLEQHCTCPVCRLELNEGGMGASNREMAMRKAHHRNVESRRMNHAQRVAEQRQRMEMMDREEREGRSRTRSSGISASHVYGGQGSLQETETGESTVAAEGKEGKEQEEGYESPEKKRRRHTQTHSSSSVHSTSNTAATSNVSSTKTVPRSTAMGKSSERHGSDCQDEAHVMGSALLASGISTGTMCGLLDRLGLGEHLAGAVEKRDVAHAIALACSRDHLISLSISELKKRAQRMQVDITTCFDKRGIVEILHEAVVSVVERDLRW